MTGETEGGKFPWPSEDAVASKYLRNHPGIATPSEILGMFCSPNMLKKEKEKIWTKDRRILHMAF